MLRKMSHYKLLLIILLIVGCDNSTEYEKVYGCTDPNAPNFDTDATIFDNSCDYNIYACADSNATNYNVNVTVDDNSCEYTSFSDYPDFETIYGMSDSNIPIEVIGNGIWGECYSIGIHETQPNWQFNFEYTPPTPYPNPFDELTNIGYSVYNQRLAKLYIVNQNYETIKTCVESIHEAGMHLYEWDGTDNEGNNVESGYYRVIYEFDNHQCFANLYKNN